MTEQTKKKEHAEEKALEKMTVKELRAVAVDIPRTTAVHDMKKDELIALIKQHRGIKDEEPGKKVKKDIVRIIQTKEQIKAKIRELMKTRAEAQEQRNKKQAVTLRKSISRLKKRSRRVVTGS